MSTYSFCRGASVSDCGNYLIVNAQQDCRDNLVFYASLVEPLKTGFSTKLELTPVVTKFEADYDVRFFALIFTVSNHEFSVDVSLCAKFQIISP